MCRSVTCSARRSSGSYDCRAPCWRSWWAVPWVPPVSASRRWSEIRWRAPSCSGCSAAAGPLDLLALGEEPAQYLGADVRRLKQVVSLAASLLTAAAVAVAGVIGFVGLIVPHVCRLVWGRLHRTLLPTAFLAGGILLVASDTLARTVVAPRELPVGIVTALVGVPLFAVLLRRWTVS